MAEGLHIIQEEMIETQSSEGNGHHIRLIIKEVGLLEEIETGIIMMTRTVDQEKLIIEI